MTPKHYLLYGSERYALAILRPLQEAIRARGHKAAWFFDGPGSEELRADETFLRTSQAVREFAPIAVLTSSNAVPPLTWLSLPSSNVRVMASRLPSGQVRVVAVWASDP